MENQCMEEEITLEETGGQYKYSLSNNFSDIVAAMRARTGLNVILDDMVPKLNPELSISVKEMMNRHNVEYSMTIFHHSEYLCAVINMRFQNEWYSAFFNEINGELVWDEDRPDNSWISDIVASVLRELD